ncbi:MAG: uracil-DNA glycosylase [Cyclobacteriaceae bacterium]|nr:uracil-DNA glycosylase [Cyclobacteriaceae bacterium]
MDVRIESGWKAILAEEFEKAYFTELVFFVKEEYNSRRIYPPGSQVFRSFEFSPYEKTRIVILGQDPYHGPGQAHGLCFSVNDGVPLPPSLRNIYKEIKNDLGLEIPVSGNLQRWATQGILLLNATLTVRDGQPGSHQGKGWEQFTDRVISLLSENKENLVFMLWGSYAQKKGAMIDRSRHLVLEAPHPSPLSVHRGFFGCHHFSKANLYLEKHGLDKVDW